ncbi:hypothetical protein NPIL_498001 [Nephila pilipes]|uniref:Uncharacterized protein n=1 Tax=Nephila pilipes TaxID=299642 RepID=A0A8X6P3S0_NEPPI|nr:hypothetical protein NPIL_498001 [Nephila pilipes]
MMDAQNNWSDRTETAMEQNANDENEIIDLGADITASPSSRVYNEDFFVKNFSTTRRAIQGRNAYAAWARKLGLTKKDDPEFLRIHEELRKAGENLDKELAQLGDVPLFKLPASEKELDAMIQKPPKPASTQETANATIAAAPLTQDRTDSASQGKKSVKRTRDSEGFISPPKHLTRIAPKAAPTVNIAEDVPTSDRDVDVNILDPVDPAGQCSEYGMDDFLSEILPVNECGNGVFGSLAGSYRPVQSDFGILEPERVPTGQWVLELDVKYEREMIAAEFIFSGDCGIFQAFSDAKVNSCGGVSGSISDSGGSGGGD